MPPPGILSATLLVWLLFGFFFSFLPITLIFSHHIGFYRDGARCLQVDWLVLVGMDVLFARLRVCCFGMGFVNA